VSPAVIDFKLALPLIREAIKMARRTMIKHCPTCNRTYSDDSISFCLADGALLSAPFDALPDEPPPTEILPADRPPPVTEPAKPVVPTMTSLPGARKYSPLPGNEPNSNRSSALVWIALAVVALAVIVIGGFAARKLLTKRTDAVATSTPEAAVAENSNAATNSGMAVASPNEAPNTNPTPKPTANSIQSPQTKSTPTPLPATLEADPVLIPPNTRSTPTPKDAGTDYSRVFNPREVDTKVRIISKPAPSYTEQARKNQVQGIVTLRVVFSATGSVTNISVVRGLPDGLSERAISAARAIEFTPATKDGRAVSVSMLLEYNFNLY
jgi:TonB family protein